MGRDGFARADIDTGLMADPKVVALARVVRDSTKTGAYVSLYVSAVLASWREGRPMTIVEGAPAWWLDPFDDAIAALRAADLIDEDARVHEHAFKAWAGRLIGYIEQQSAYGREGARRRWHPDQPIGSPNGVHMGSPVGSPLGSPVGSPMHQPAVPANPASRRARKREEPDTKPPIPIADILRRMEL